MKTIRTFLFISIAGIIFSCGNIDSKPSDVYSKDEFKEILIDLHIAEALERSFLMDDSLKSHGTFVEIEILKKHHSDTAQFNKSFTWYSARPELMGEVFDMVSIDLSKLKAEATAGKMK